MHAGQSDDDQTLIIQSGMLDEAYYATQVQLPAGMSAAHHYLDIGWQWEVRPRQDFENSFLRPFYEASGLSGPPLLTWLGLIAGGVRRPSTQAEAQGPAAIVRASSLFHPQGYSAKLPAGMDPAMHYVLVGEALGWMPSEAFDPNYYNERYPDIEANGLSPLLHYEQFGRQEGRRPVDVARRLQYPAVPDNGKPTVLMVAHDASRTGAPLLGWMIGREISQTYNVVAVLLRGGELEPDFAAHFAAVVGPMTWEEWHPVEMSRVADRLTETYHPLYAVSNSIETNLLVPPLSVLGVPCVALLHEFAAYTRPLAKMSNVFDWATDIVFPANIVAESSYRYFPHLATRRGVHVFAQGRVDPPPMAAVAKPAADHKLQQVAAALRDHGHFVVLGAGTVHIRKGVDVFISVAAAVQQLAPFANIRFVWIGDGYDPLHDSGYSAYLSEHIDRAGLADIVTIVPPVSNLEEFYSVASVFLMCSRLDPQPNVGIDSITRGLPVVCFENASGTAEVLATDPLTRGLVAPYLDAHAAAEIICGLAADGARYTEMCHAVRQVGLKAFDMRAYVQRVDAMGLAAAARLREADRRVLLDAEILDASLALPLDQFVPDLTRLANIVLHQWAVVGTSLDQVSNKYFRRPCAGFHPQAYAENHTEACVTGNEQPLVHWLRAGRPAGVWSREVFNPLPTPRLSRMRVALHGHFFYDDKALDLRERLSTNATSCDLFLTTDSKEKATRLRSMFLAHPGAVEVSLVPNQGRDIGPFLASLGRIEAAGYDIVGHVHGKQSDSTDAKMGDRWRDFLWENLLGGMHPMTDTVAHAFESCPELGLLMAEDPHLVGWNKNRGIAEILADRCGIKTPLDTFFDFPLGTMFWIRRGALKPLLDLDLQWSDYPTEPLSDDGTILHALERLIPFVVRGTTMTIASVRVPVSSW